jgi:hypothetical protein
MTQPQAIFGLSDATLRANLIVRPLATKCTRLCNLQTPTPESYLFEVSNFGSTPTSAKFRMVLNHTIKFARSENLRQSIATYFTTLSRSFIHNAATGSKEDRSEHSMRRTI